MRGTMRLRRVTIVLATIISINTIGCATIMSGATQNVSFISNPEEANVSLNGKILGKTPLSVPLKKKTKQSVVLTKEGFKPLTISLDTKTDGWFMGNFLIGGLPGSTTDGLSGAIHEYTKDNFMVALVPEGASKLEEGTIFTPKQEFQNFVLSNYVDIKKNLYNKHGEYLTSLVSLIDVPNGKQTEDLIQNLSVYGKESHNGLELSEKILKNYQIKEAQITPISDVKAPTENIKP
jgi:hypothetical protein